MAKNVFFVATIMMVCATSCSLMNADMEDFAPNTPVHPILPTGKPYEVIEGNERIDGINDHYLTTEVMAVKSTVDTLFVKTLNASAFNEKHGSIEEGTNMNKKQGNFVVTNFIEFCKGSLSDGINTVSWKDSMKSASVILNTSDTSYTFVKGVWSVSNSEKEIGAQTYPTINGKSYIAQPIIVTLYYKYEAKSEYVQGTNYQTYSLTHTLVLLALDSIQGRHDTIANEIYSFDAMVSNGGMTSVLNSTVNENSYDQCVMIYDDIQSRTSVREPMNLKVTARLSNPRCKTTALGYPVSVKAHTTGVSTKSSTVTANGFLRETTSFSEHYGFDDGQTADFDCSFENLMQNGTPFMGYTEITSINLNNADIEVEGNGSVKVCPRVQLKKHDIDGKVSFDEKQMELIYMQEEEDVILYTFVESSVVPSSANTFTATADFYAMWKQAGKKSLETKTATLSASLTATDGSDLTVTSVSFTTTGSGLTTTGSGIYSDNATNGSENFVNSYSWSADGDVTLTYDTLSVTFKTSFVLTEAGQVIGTPSTSADGFYDVYPYSNKVNAVYTVNSETINLSATAHRSLLKQKEVEDVIPGTILGVNLTYVPVIPGTFNGGNGYKTLAKCFSIDRLLNGKIEKVLVITNVSTLFPTAADVAKGTVHSTDYRSYNSAVYIQGTGWVPGTASGGSGSDWIWTAYTGGQTHVGSETVSKWNWQSIAKSPFCPGFSAVDHGNGLFILMMNGESVLWK